MQEASNIMFDCCGFGILFVVVGHTHTECRLIEGLLTGRLKEAIYSQHIVSRKNKNESWDCYYCVFGLTQEGKRHLIPWDLGLKIWWKDDETQTNQA